jgi:hypothetical protein
MKNIIVRFVLIVLISFMSGCVMIGYMVIVNTKQVRYDDLQHIRRRLEEKGYKTVIWERKKDMPKHVDEVHTLFEKKLSSKPYYVVSVHLSYVKDKPGNIVRNLEVDVRNIRKGMTVDQLKEEIDRTGDLIYQELVDKVGKENVVIKRVEIHHPLIAL